MTIGSWLVAVEPGASAAVRTALLARRGIECRCSGTETTLVVLSECDPAEVENVHAALWAITGVRNVALVAAFEEEADA